MGAGVSQPAAAAKEACDVFDPSFPRRLELAGKSCELGDDFRGCYSFNSTRC